MDMQQPLLRGSESPLPRRVLVVEDNHLARSKLHECLSSWPSLQVDSTGDGHQALALLTERDYSVAIIDLRLPGLDGMDLIREVQQRSIPVTLIVTTAHGSIQEAVEAMQRGAHDFLTKPLELEHLNLVVERALRERVLRDELAHLREQLQQRFSFHNILSKSPQMHAIFELIGNVAHTNTTVLIEGETGTGKEQVARAIHHASVGRTGPLIAVNCAALPENLLESELFGHEKGAFTSAVGQRRGRFELANGGTIFLDEVGDVPPPMQAKLLRVLQERRFERVGGAETIEVDVRVIGATNRSLRRLVRKGRFREDLYYRLNVVKIDLPPLRERLEDVPLLATHFAQKYKRPGSRAPEISSKAMDVLLKYPWPGNIRELENAVERACITSQNELIEVTDLPPELSQAPMPRDMFRVNLDRPLPDQVREAVSRIEADYIRKALRKVHGHVGRCARICGMSRRSISAKIAEYGIDRSELKDW